jgi:hypothetical protein
VVLEVDEACILKTLEDGLGCGFLGGRVPGEEGPEVNELHMSDNAWQQCHGAYWNDQVVLCDCLRGIDVRHRELCRVQLRRTSDDLCRF